MTKRSTQILLIAILLGAFAATTMAADFTYTNDQEALATMDRLIERLAHRSNLQVSFHAVILPLEQINAFSVSDGRIIVTQGLLQTISSEEELAGAIAHEMGHQITRMKSSGTQAFTAFGDDEFTADALAIQFLKKAGYDPSCLAEMLRVVLHSDGASFPKAQAKQLNSRIRKIEDKIGSQVSSVKTGADHGGA